LKELLKMSQSLNYTSILATLVTLGAVACGGSAPPAESPVEAKEVPAATATEAAPAAAGDSTAKSDAPAAAPGADAPAAPAADAPAAPAADAGKPADPKAPVAPAAAHKKKAAGAKAGCGAGTCG
jgi:pyruvate dehydrogenase E2 component (dihydrolipoamide acetyltransferase)